MNSEPAKSPILETTQDAIASAKTMLRLARYGAVAAIEPETGYPITTRTNVATTMGGNPVFLMSDLAAHTKAIKGDARTSLLVGEPGKGDPLAHPRITLIGITKAVPVSTQEEKEQENNLRQRYLARHPKAELYNQLPDFFLYELHIERALLNAGFGKAYELTGADLTLKGEETNELAEAEQGIITHMNEDHHDAIENYAVKLCNQPEGKWRMSGCDPDGIDMLLGDKATRLEFKSICTTPIQVREALVAYAKQAKN